MRSSSRPLASVAALFFMTGMAALIYEVLWLKELGLLFGNTSQAMATTLTAFFLGLAAGSYYWGRKAAAYREPLKLYAGLEVAVAVCAAGYFILLEAYGRIYPWVFDCCGNHAGLFTGVKFALSLTVLFPPAFFMGGTLPVLSHFAAPNRDDLGRNTALLYGVNTLGAVAGALLAGFYLPVWLGFRASYGLAMAISLTVAAGAYVLSKPQTERSRAPVETGSIVFRPLAVIAFMSGLSMLALQVLWGRMFAQVLQNSVYTFALILSVFLICLALSGFLARWLMAVRFDAGKLLFGSLIAGGLLVNIGPFVFLAWTDELHYIGSDVGWYAYLLQIAAPAAVIMGPPLLLLGMALPLSIRLAQNHGPSGGALVGQLVGINTLGAIAGSIIAGFLILEWMGLWAGIRLIAVLYFLTAAYWFSRTTEITSNYRQPGLSDSQKLFRSDWWSQRGGLYLPAIGILLAVSAFDTGKLPLVKVDPVNEEESLLEFWESSAGTVAVIRRGEHLKIKVNNHYTLGGTGSFKLEQLTGSLPVALHRKPRSVYILGLGTGITAGGVLEHPIQSLTVTELLNDVVAASDKYFGAYTNGLFYDPRVRVLHEDGRNYLRGAREKFDVMIGDLFVPWEAGTGSLYSLEHFRTVAERLNENGLFMQWLPAYQLSQVEFDVIARTFLEVFPYATVWRADFGALRPVLGLLGSKSNQDFAALSAERHQKLLLHFAGDLVSIRSRFEQARLNTDDRPIIEFSAPVSQRSIKTGRQEWLVGADLIELMEALQPSVSDYMIDVPKPSKQWPQAGFNLQKAQWLRYQGRLKEAEQAMANYRKLLGEEEQ
ncbi:fused MFS/spermidine synthase [Methylotuvimicrobium alcaliphilum]|uniref:PABS domain-containing protein n=1 Tax=Methylotuvimicrobium alcaliphilum (strain DSM 19304 / NCIMB 14124 / VKM B-2133 / 20Z) TaxID=1091494 RepID=G4SUM7_META2|nr:fused MFS/spermidine synthase [Methylotuvimicrobium alcaliphilum]CCE22854.1 conserved protein of unknown function; putative spermidine synthase domain [Methylotuvimicrobium alcaliphilum 20Z]